MWLLDNSHILERSICMWEQSMRARMMVISVGLGTPKKHQLVFIIYSYYNIFLPSINHEEKRTL